MIDVLIDVNMNIILGEMTHSVCIDVFLDPGLTLLYFFVTSRYCTS